MLLIIKEQIKSALRASNKDTGVGVAICVTVRLGEMFPASVFTLNDSKWI